jgi:hypothetical protein
MEHPERDERDIADTSETEMTGSTEPGVVATPEGTAEVDPPDADEAVAEEAEVDEELEDRGDV